MFKIGDPVMVQLHPPDSKGRGGVSAQGEVKAIANGKYLVRHFATGKLHEAGMQQTSGWYTADRLKRTPR